MNVGNVQTIEAVVEPHAVPEPAPGRGNADDWLPLTAHGVERISGLDDPVLRNLWITQSYADLGARLLGRFRSDQSWCSFATWASNTAGLSIREAELPHVLNALLHDTTDHLDAIADGMNRHPRIVRSLGLVRLGVVRTVHRTALGHLVEQALAQVSDFIADGNVLVYAELAPVFVRFAEWLETGGADEQNVDVDAVLTALGVPSADDEPLVHSAFRSYVEAACADEDCERAQLVLAANIAAVLHEQQRLQDDIRDALDADMVDIGSDLESICHRLVPERVERWIVARAKRRVAPHLTALWEHVATRMMMTLTVPGQTLHLGRDLPPGPEGELFPPALGDITRAELRELLDEWDPTGGTGRGCAARDWADLHQRMGYIVNLFRSRQQELDLSVSPFSDAQLATMRDGMVPRTV